MKLSCNFRPLVLLLAVLALLQLPIHVQGQAVVTKTFNTLSFTQVIVVPPRTTPFLTFLTFLTVSASSTTTISNTVSITQSIPLTRTAIEYSFVSASTTRTISITTTASTSSVTSAATNSHGNLALWTALPALFAFYLLF